MDDYEDWSKLAWARADGMAKILRRGPGYDTAVRLLKEKYPAYRRMDIERHPLIQIQVERMILWRAAS